MGRSRPVSSRPAAPAVPAAPPEVITLLGSASAQPEEAGDLRASLSTPRTGLSLLTVSGEIDTLTAPQLATALDELLAVADGDLAIDLDGVTFLASSGYIHCRKHIPRMERVTSRRAWGTDDPARKGGDFFGAKGTPQRTARLRRRFPSTTHLHGGASRTGSTEGGSASSRG